MASLCVDAGRTTKYISPGIPIGKGLVNPGQKMRSEQKIGVLIPALNEEKAIARVIQDIPDWVDRVVVVDNGSSDDTSKVAAALNVDVTREPQRGYGAACLTGIARLQDMDMIVFLDGDYSDYPEEMVMLVDPIIEGKSDLVIGSRTSGQSQSGSLTLQQIAGNWLACRLMNLIWSTHYTDLGPFRAIRTSTLEKLEMKDRGYGWTIEMQIKSALHQIRVSEVPVSYRVRIGKSKISGTIKGTVLASLKIISVIMRFALRSNAAAIRVQDE